MAGNAATVVYTDGSCAHPYVPDPERPGWQKQAKVGLGSWAWWVNNALWDHGVVQDTNSGRMELLAVIQALQSPHIDPDYPVTIVSDATYVVDGVNLRMPEWQKTGKWLTTSGKPIADEDYWRKLASLIDGRVVSFFWVYGHRRTRGNIRADALAKSARKKYLKESQA